MFPVVTLNLSKHPGKSSFHLPVSRPIVKEEGHGNLETPDKAGLAICKCMFHLLFLLVRLLLNLALKLSTSLQGGEIQHWVFDKNGKYVVEE